MSSGGGGEAGWADGPLRGRRGGSGQGHVVVAGAGVVTRPVVAVADQGERVRARHVVGEAERWTTGVWAAGAASQRAGTAVRIAMTTAIRPCLCLRLRRDRDTEHPFGPPGFTRHEGEKDVHADGARVRNPGCLHRTCHATREKAPAWRKATENLRTTVNSQQKHRVSSASPKGISLCRPQREHERVGTTIRIRRHRQPHVGRHLHPRPAWSALTSLAADAHRGSVTVVRLTTVRRASAATTAASAVRTDPRGTTRSTAAPPRLTTSTGVPP